MVNPSIHPPRTPADFDAIDRLVWAGATNEEILQLLQCENWRGEVIHLQNGHLACAICRQIIKLKNCLECGQPEVHHEK